MHLGIPHDNLGDVVINERLLAAARGMYAPALLLAVPFLTGAAAAGLLSGPPRPSPEGLVAGAPRGQSRVARVSQCPGRVL